MIQYFRNVKISFRRQPFNCSLLAASWLYVFGFFLISGLHDRREQRVHPPAEIISARFRAAISAGNGAELANNSLQNDTSGPPPSPDVLANFFQHWVEPRIAPTSSTNSPEELSPSGDTYDLNHFRIQRGPVEVLGPWDEPAPAGPMGGQAGVTKVLIWSSPAPDKASLALPFVKFGKDWKALDPVSNALDSIWLRESSRSTSARIQWLLLAQAVRRDSKGLTAYHIREVKMANWLPPMTLDGIAKFCELRANKSPQSS